MTSHPGDAALAGPDMSTLLPRLQGAARRTRSLAGFGRVVRATGTVIHAIAPDVRVGEMCRLEDPRTGFVLMAEVVGLAGEEAVLTPIGDLKNVSTTMRVVPTGAAMRVRVGPGLLGRVLDARGNPLDGRGPLEDCPLERPVMASPPDPMTRPVIDRPLALGVRALDGALTCGLGQRMGIYGEPGGGKSTLLAQIVRNGDAEVYVLGLIGERGREVREFIEHNLGPQGMARSVVVVATSDRSALERSKAAYVATAMAEYFRDQGRDVVLIMDSVTRFARAQREIGLAAGEPPTRRGFPPSIFTELPQLMERAGRAEIGSITALYTVLVEGDGTGDPVAEETRSILDGHIILSARLAAANHYPAIDVLTSRSRVMDAVVDPEHGAAAGELRSLLAAHAEVEFLLQVGEYKPGADAVTDKAVERIDLLRAFLRQRGDEADDFEATRRWLIEAVG